MEAQLFTRTLENFFKRKELTKELPSPSKLGLKLLS
jgi:hypothetical protein